ncbi:hypothetical protein M3210_16890 [Oceanobacillus luteolus]|uniref:Uncharacterized protein n=1 Tax=Oceanobacillus luteolus TaxID=1274358 RepID=A0ABW4HTI5_9BACI|nr:hypothetical protein [Oceanobacillus luteolus]
MKMQKPHHNQTKEHLTFDEDAKVITQSDARMAYVQSRSKNYITIERKNISRSMRLQKL